MARLRPARATSLERDSSSKRLCARGTPLGRYRYVEDIELAKSSIPELLAMVVQTRAPLPDMIDGAGGLEGLAHADPFEIAAHLEGRHLDGPRAKGRPVRSTTLGKARSLAAAFELGRRIEIARAKPPDKFTSAAAVAAWAQPRIAALRHEELWLLALDGRGHLRAARCLAKGGLHGAAVHAAHPIRTALRLDASAFVLVHNHPSGDPTPSKEDITLTANIAAAAEVATVPLLDHVVVAREGFACVPWPDEAKRAPPSTRG